MGFFSGSKSYSTSSSYSGLQAGDMGNYFKVANRTPGDYSFQTDLLQDRVRNSGNVLGLDSNGFIGGQGLGIDAMARNAFSGLSSNAALRGLLHKENMPGLVGNTMTALGPTLMNTVSANVLGNQNITANRFDQLNQAMSQVPGLLGTEQHTASASKGPSLGYNLMGYAAGAAGYGAGVATKGGAAA